MSTTKVIASVGAVLLLAVCGLSVFFAQSSSQAQVADGANAGRMRAMEMERLRQPVAVAATDLKAKTKLTASNMKVMPLGQACGDDSSVSGASKPSLVGAVLKHDIQAGKMILPSDVTRSAK